MHKFASLEPSAGAQALRAALQPMKGNQGRPKETPAAEPQKRHHGLPRYIGEIYNSESHAVLLLKQCTDLQALHMLQHCKTRR